MKNSSIKLAIISASLLLLFISKPFISDAITSLWHQMNLTAFPKTIFYFLLSIQVYVLALVFGKRFKQKERKTRWVTLTIILGWAIVRFFPTPMDYDTLWDDGPFYFWDVAVLIFILIFELESASDLEIIKPKTYEYGFFNPDLSIKELAKLQNKKTIDLDELGYATFAKEIALTLQKLQTKNAFAIGINGAWGNGKSSLFDLIESDLENVNNLQLIRFSPWLYESSESIITEFFASVRPKIHENNPETDLEFKKYLDLISKAEKQIFKTDFFENLLFEPKNNVDLQKQRDILSDKLEKTNNKYIVFIDDLDRLQQSEIPYVLKLIKAIADLPNFIYIIAYDRPYIETAINNVITTHSPEKYLDKIVNIEFTLPEINPTKRKDYLYNWIESQLKKTKRADIGNVQECFNQLKNYSEIDYFLKTIRDLKRFSNILFLRYMSVDPAEVNFDHFFYLQLIDYKDPKITRRIYERRQDLFDQFNGPNQLAQNDIGKINLIKGVLGFSSGADLDPVMALLIFKLFNETHGRPIVSKFHFQTYFSLQLFKENIKMSEVSFSILSENENEMAVLFERNPLELIYKIRLWFQGSENNLLTANYDKAFRTVSYLYLQLEKVKEIEEINWLEYNAIATCLINKPDPNIINVWEKLKKYAGKNYDSKAVIANLFASHYYYNTEEKLNEEIREVLSLYETIVDGLIADDYMPYEVRKFITLAYRICNNLENQSFNSILLLREKLIDPFKEYFEENFSVLGCEDLEQNQNASKELFFPREFASYYRNNPTDTWGFFFSFYTKLYIDSIEEVLDRYSFRIVTKDGMRNGNSTTLTRTLVPSKLYNQWETKSDSDSKSENILNYFQLNDIDGKTIIELGESDKYKRLLRLPIINHELYHYLEETVQSNYIHLELLVSPKEDFIPYLRLSINKRTYWFCIIIDETSQVQYKEHSNEEFTVYCKPNMCEDGFMRIYLDIAAAFEQTFKKRDKQLAIYKIDAVKFRGFGKIATVRLYRNNFQPRYDVQLIPD